MKEKDDGLQKEKQGLAILISYIRKGNRKNKQQKLRRVVFIFNFFHGYQHKSPQKSDNSDRNFKKA